MKSQKYYLTITLYLDDGWYGERKRVYLDKEFANKTEAKHVQSKFKKYIKEKHQYTKWEINQTEIGELESFKTYIHSVGPSYHCPQIKIEMEDWVKWLENYNNKLLKGE